MKKIIHYTLFVLFSICIYCSCSTSSDEFIYEEPSGTSEGTALIITGAAAKITHELALIERLHEKGELDDVQFISGVSSGAIMSILTNAVLGEATNWEIIKNYTFSLKQEDVLSNPRNSLPIDTRGLWSTFETLFSDSLGINSIKQDLNIPTSLTAVRFDNRALVKISNVPQLNSITDSPIEGLMSSTSFPAVFPAIRINDIDYVDGGLVENIPYSAVLEYEMIRQKPFSKIIIVSFQKNTTIDWSLELNLISLRGRRESVIEKLLELSGFSLDAMANKHFIETLTEINTTYKNFAAKTVIYTPKIENPPYFPTFQFDGDFSKKVYDLVREWALENDPISLEMFLESN